MQRTAASHPRIPRVASEAKPAPQRGGALPCAIAGLLLVAACGGADGRGRDRVPVGADSVPPAPGVAYPAESVRPMRAGERGHVAADPIQWDAAVVAAHLSGMGLEPEAMGAVTRPIFRVPGQRFHVRGGRAVVEAFFYGDANAVAQDADKLDTVLVAPRGGHMAWEMAPRLVIDNNMAAIVMANDASLRAMIEAALHSRLHGRTWVP